MREHLTQVRADTPHDELVEHDVAFHRLIAAATGNDYLVSLLETISSQTARARVWRGLTEDGAVPRTLHEHERILDAIESGDAEIARAAMVVHVAGVEHWLHDAADREAKALEADAV